MLSRSKKAFTLLELIVVIVVLGILAALAIPSFTTVKQKSADKVAYNTAASIYRAASAAAAFDGVAVDMGHVNTAGNEISTTGNTSFTGGLFSTSVTTSVNGVTGTAWVCDFGPSTTICNNQ